MKYLFCLFVLTAFVGCDLGEDFDKPLPPRPKGVANSKPGFGNVVLFGDSIAYGKGATNENHSLEGCLSKYYQQDVVNMGASGVTSTQAMEQLNQLLIKKPAMAVISLGSADLLATSSNSVTEKETLDNLKTIYQKLIDQGALVVHVGFNPPNRNVDRLTKLEAEALAMGVLFVSDTMNGLWGRSEYMFDELHPNDKGYSIVCDRLISGIGKNYP